MHDDLDRARAESAELLGLNPDKLTPAGALKCELVSALRSVVDDELGKVDRANAADLSRLIVAVEALTKFLKESPADERSEDDEDGDPHERLMRIIDNWIAANEAERAERAIDVTPGADAMPMTREGEPDTVARGGTGGLIPPTGANDDDGIDGELIDVTPKPEPEPAAVETKPDLEDGIDGEMA